MIKQNQKYLNTIHIIIDALVLCISFGLAYVIRFETVFDYRYSRRFFPTVLANETFFQALMIKSNYAKALLYLVPLYLIIYFTCHLYSPKRFRNQHYEFINLVKANIIGMIGFILLLYVTEPKYFSRLMLLFFFLINILLDFLFRHIVHRILRKTRKLGKNQKHVIVIGFSIAGASYIDRIRENPQWGYTLHGIFDDNVNKDFEYRHIPWIGRIKDLPEYLATHNLDEVAITLNIKEYAKLENLVKICEKSGVHTKFVPDYYNFISSKPYTEDLNGLPVINIRNVPLTNTFHKTVKRFVDIVGSLVAILLFSPVMIITAILVKKSSPGPIIFKQVRVGLGNQEFSMYKFRSMGVQDPSKEKAGWTTSQDPRVTPIGKIIRKTSIDELPQLFNVLKGDMSLVGPRPERPQFVKKFQEEIPRYMIKHQVRPGMTGWAQINGYRGDTSIKGRIEHDLYYIENWTLGLDIKILFLTIFKGFVNKNAY